VCGIGNLILWDSHAAPASWTGRCFSRPGGCASRYIGPAGGQQATLVPMMSRMVALPVPRPGEPPSTGQQASIDITLPASKLRPRDGASASWRYQFNEAVAQLRLSSNINEPEPPSYQQLLQQLPASIDTQQSVLLHEAALEQWYSERTQLFRLTEKCLDLSGPMEESDLTYIRNHFHWSDYRDGRGLLL
jgi:hypothetical protein